MPPIRYFFDDPGQAKLPAPTVVRAGDFLFTSTISAPGNGDVIGQARELFDRLEQALDLAGSSVSRLLRCEVMLADGRDFFEFNLAWRHRFAVSPPARLVIGVGLMYPCADALIGLQAIALAGDSKLIPEPIFAANAVDTMAGEHAPQAIRAGDYVFTTTIPAIESYRSGLINVRDPLEAIAEAQAVSEMQNLNAVLGECDTSLEHAVKAQNLLGDLADWNVVNRAWGRYMVPHPPPRSSVSIQSLIAPGARVLTSVIALIPSATNERRAVRKGVRFQVSEHGYNFSPAVRTNEWISLAGQMAYDYATFTPIRANSPLPHLVSEIEAQVDAIMDDRLAILEANGASNTDILEAKVYMTDPRHDYAGFARAWGRWFPEADGSPVLQVVPVTGVHYDGTLIEIELLAAAQ
jgi:2-iminobutanoate/2-iminopropanoate deaminase